MYVRMNQLNPLHIFALYFPKTHLNIIMKLPLRLNNLSLTSRVYEHFECTYHLYEYFTSCLSVLIALTVFGQEYEDVSRNKEPSLLCEGLVLIEMHDGT
jgi:hypothetical protein